MHGNKGTLLGGFAQTSRRIQSAFSAPILLALLQCPKNCPYHGLERLRLFLNSRSYQGDTAADMSWLACSLRDRPSHAECKVLGASFMNERRDKG